MIQFLHDLGALIVITATVGGFALVCIMAAELLPRRRK